MILFDLRFVGIEFSIYNIYNLKIHWTTGKNKTKTSGEETFRLSFVILPYSKLLQFVLRRIPSIFLYDYVCQKTSHVS